MNDLEDVNKQNYYFTKKFMMTFVTVIKTNFIEVMLIYY